MGTSRRRVDGVGRLIFEFHTGPRHDEGQESTDVPPAFVVAYRRETPRHARRDEDGEDGVAKQGPNCVALSCKQPFDIV